MQRGSMPLAWITGRRARHAVQLSQGIPECNMELNEYLMALK